MKTCRDYGNRRLICPGIVIHRAENDIRVFSRKILYIFGRIGRIHQSNITGHIDNDMRRTGNRRLKQRTGNRLLYCLQRFVIAASLSDTDMRDTLIRHNSLNIGKIQVNQRRYVDQICNALNTLLQYLVRLLKSLRHRSTSVNYFKQFIVRDNNQCIHALFQLFNP